MISLENATVCIRCFLFQLSQGFAQPSIVTMLESVLLSVLQIAIAKETASVVVTAAGAFADGQCIKVLCRLRSLSFSLVCLYPVRKSSDIIFVDKTRSRLSVGYEWSLTPEEKKNRHRQQGKYKRLARLEDTRRNGSAEIFASCVSRFKLRPTSFL